MKIVQLRKDSIPTAWLCEVILCRMRKVNDCSPTAALSDKASTCSLTTEQTQEDLVSKKLAIFFFTSRGSWHVPLR